METDSSENLKRAFHFAKLIAHAFIVEDARVREAPAPA
jgi:hypothetical protein